MHCGCEAQALTHSLRIGLHGGRLVLQGFPPLKPQQQGSTEVSQGASQLPASALFASPKQASAIPARPTPNLFSACRRVVDWANPLASSSNLLIITVLSFLFFVVRR
jgi:hypothetical protein